MASSSTASFELSPPLLAFLLFWDFFCSIFPDGFLAFVSSRSGPPPPVFCSEKLVVFFLLRSPLGSLPQSVNVPLSRFLFSVPRPATIFATFLPNYSENKATPSAINVPSFPPGFPITHTLFEDFERRPPFPNATIPPVFWTPSLCAMATLVSSLFGFYNLTLSLNLSAGRHKAFFFVLIPEFFFFHSSHS